MDSQRSRQKLPDWVLVALPIGMTGLAVCLFVFTMLFRTGWIGNACWYMIAALVLTVIAGAVVGVLRRLPLWSHTWLITAVAMVFIATNVLQEAPMVSPLVLTVLDPALLTLLGLEAIVAAYRGWRHAAVVVMGLNSAITLLLLLLVTAGPVARPSLALLAALVSLGLAACPACFARRPSAQLWPAPVASVALSLAMMLVLGLSPDDLLESFVPTMLMIWLSFLVIPACLAALFALLRKGQQARLRTA